jgi:hypothetical protein
MKNFRVEGYGGQKNTKTLWYPIYVPKPQDSPRLNHCNEFLK